MTNTSSSFETRVSARLYRPQTLSELVGQDTLVQTLRNAIFKNRLPHAFLLTGIRGVGKTTTARILAKGLNCQGPDGKGGPTPDPCGQCPSCQMIAADRLMDVVEMDAASHTSVDDIRELIDAARYKPGQARYKIYIIDEAHMLSKSAFNALLKTLETPPGYVKFIFATTEVRKIPATILSRCMRFDLGRIPLSTLKDLFRSILEKEGYEMEEDGLTLIAQAADGSARDGLSLLDQAIALSSEEEEKSPILAEQVRHLLGLGDPTLLTKLYSFLLEGKSKEALEQANLLYKGGTEGQTLLEELMSLTHQLTLWKTTQRTELLPPARGWIEATAPLLSMAVLTRFWQMLLKGYEETQRAPLIQEAVEMALIRLAYVKDLPILSEQEEEKKGARGTSLETKPVVAAFPAPGPTSPSFSHEEPQPIFSLKSLKDIIDVMESQREPLLRFHLIHHTHFINLKESHLEVSLEPEVPPSFVPDLKRVLQEVTRSPWTITVHKEGGSPTLSQEEKEQKDLLFRTYKQDPWVQEVLTTFPGSTIQTIDMIKETS